jgi:hypothetical protein
MPDSIGHLSLEQVQQILPVAIFGQGLRQLLQGFSGDPLLVEGDFFGAGDHEALAFLQRGDKASGFEQAVVGAGIKPGVAAAHDFDVELVLRQIAFVDVGDFQLAAM